MAKVKGPLNETCARCAHAPETSRFRSNTGMRAAVVGKAARGGPPNSGSTGFDCEALNRKGTWDEHVNPARAERMRRMLNEIKW
jgi:hypothetical protein